MAGADQIVGVIAQVAEILRINTYLAGLHRACVIGSLTANVKCNVLYTL